MVVHAFLHVVEKVIGVIVLLCVSREGCSFYVRNLDLICFLPSQVN